MILDQMDNPFVAVSLKDLSLNELNQLEGVTWGRFYCHINKNVIECSGEE